MALLASIATGNFTTASTWGVVNATSLNNSESLTTVVTTSYLTSTTSVPGAITISHIAIKLSVRTGTTGTITVALDNAGSDVAGTVVTIDTADLPAAATAASNGGWIFFKFASAVTLVAATAYGVKVRTSTAAQVSLFVTSANNWARALVTTTTGAPAATDDMIISGDYTGAGTSNSYVVTMDNTAATDFGAASTNLVLPTVAVCSKGTLSYGIAASTAYTMRVSGNFIIYSGGIFNMGSVGAEIPRNSSAELFFDCGTNVDFGLTVRDLGTFNSAGLSRTSGNLSYFCKLNTDEAIASTSLGVDTDTGWLDNDIIAVASTTRTNTQCERGQLNGAAGASTLTVDSFAGAGGGLAFAHSGTAPALAEIILLTRNVSIRGASTTLQAFVDVTAISTLNCSWTSFRWMGSSTSRKRGIDVATNTGTFNMDYCSLFDFVAASSIGLNIVPPSGSGITINRTVFFNLASNLISNQITTGVQTFTNLIGMLTVSSTGFFFRDVNSVYENIMMVGSAGVGISIAEISAVMTADAINIATHSNASNGITIGTMLVARFSGGLTSWRNNGVGITTVALQTTVTDMNAYGNLTNNFANTSNTGFVTLINPVLSGDSTFSTTNGISVTAATAWAGLNIINGDLGTATGIRVAHSTDIGMRGDAPARITTSATILASPTQVAGFSTNNFTDSIVTAQNLGDVAGKYKTWLPGGSTESNTTTVRTGTTSLQMTPVTASFKLRTIGINGGFKCAVESGTTVTPTVFVYEDASYNGARARLIVLANIPMGIAADTVLATATAASDLAWESLSGTTASVTSNGTLEFVVDCDGTAGNLFVDSFSVA